MLRLAAAAVFLLLVAGLAVMASAVRPQVEQAQPVETAAIEPPPAPEHARPPSRTVATALIAPPDLRPDEVERVEPRAPLGDLGQALPPKPVPPDQWEGTLLHRALAVASARFESLGYVVEIAGTVSVMPDETCEKDGVSWACGQRARGAVRQWLRGRALSCIVPPQPERTVLVSRCQLGKQDVGAWLVSMGWARAVPGGPYVEAEAKAREHAMGIYGSPPDTTLPPAVELQPTPQLELGDVETIMPPDEIAPALPPVDGDPI
ncbi:MAG: thermonuclease family protein [Rhizobiaceae bacterium]